MSRKRHRPGTIPTFGLAFLDLLSCAFGAVIILAVIVSASASQRARVQRMVVVVDAELSLGKADPALASLDEFPMSITIAGADWTATWQDGHVVAPFVPELTDWNSVASCGSGSGCSIKHATISGRGLKPGRYGIHVFGPRAPTSDIHDKELKLVVRVFYDGRRQLLEEQSITLKELQGTTTTLWAGYVDLRPAGD
jgi:hypothetical protein